MSIALALFTLAQVASAHVTVTRWNEYANGRFAYRACYPGELRALREADNGDGRVFTNASGVELRVWGSYGPGALDMTLAHGAGQDAATLSRVTYKAVGNDWYVVSGTSKDRVVYFKTLARDDRWISLRLSYPRAAARQWNPFAKRIASCLKALPATRRK